MAANEAVDVDDVVVDAGRVELEVDVLVGGVDDVWEVAAEEGLVTIDGEAECSEGLVGWAACRVQAETRASAATAVQPAARPDGRRPRGLTVPGLGRRGVGRAISALGRA